MKKWIIGMLVLLMGLGMSTAVYAETSNVTKVTVHYTPKAGDKTDWSLWVWGKGENGARYEFTSEDANGVKIAEIELPGKHEEVGFIVSTADWVKDGGDRFITIVDGVGEAHVLGGGSDTGSNGQYTTILWAVVGLISAIVFITVMEHRRKLQVRIG